MTSHPNRRKKNSTVAMERRKATTKAKTKVQPTIETTISASAAKVLHDQTYGEFLQALKLNFSTADKKFLFTTDATGLYKTYLRALPKSERAICKCRACEFFFDRYAGLVALNDAGMAWSPFWFASAYGYPKRYVPMMEALRDRVKAAKVIGVFCTDESLWGRPPGDGWTHIAVAPSHKNRGPEIFGKSPSERMAAMAHRHETVKGFLQDTPYTYIIRAIELLESKALNRGEQFLAPANWLMVQWTKRSNARLWYAVAHAPEGFCHPRASMLGNLIDSIRRGTSMTDIIGAWNAQMDPTAYQRPQAAPATGAITSAERLVAKLGVESSLARRFARLEDLELDWRPSPGPMQSPFTGLFSHLRTTPAKPPIPLGLQRMTWTKFASQVLPYAQSIELQLGRAHSFIALTTAHDPEAPPILKWDFAVRRNPVAWYCYAKLTTPSQWGLSGSFVQVTGVTKLPCQWGTMHQPQHQGTVLVLKGCVDRQNTGSGLFPELLKLEFHAIRSTIEAHSNRTPLQGRESASACGVDIRPNREESLMLRVTTSTTQGMFHIDRWD
jgi:hypothetical protein